MTYPLLRFVHLLGLSLMAAGLIGVWFTDFRSRQTKEFQVYAEAVRNIAVLYDGLVVPGALLLLGSGMWMTVTVWGGWAFLGMPWLAGMVALFAFEFVEGNTVTRLYFLRLRRLTRESLEQGGPTAELIAARRHRLPTFTHFLDIPILFVIVALGAMRPTTWAPFLVGMVLALVAATVLTFVVPRLYPWRSKYSCWWLVALLLAASAGPASAAPAPCAPPASVGDGWQTAEPQASGFDAGALCAVLKGVAGGGANIHGVIVERHGRLVAELYRRGKDRSIWSLFARETEFGPGVLHDLRSVSKTIVGLLFGIARQQHAIDLSASPLAFYPKYANLHSPARDAITLEHLLTMSSGFEWHETVTSYGTLANDETRLYWDWAPSRHVLGRPIVAKPGTAFNYNGGGTSVLADIIVRTTHTRLRDFARTTLFEPLGIREWEWVGDLYGRPLAFAGVRMRPRDLAKIGRLVLAHGQWQGRQIVPSDWVMDSVRPHIAAGGLHYGYQWWIGTVDWGGRELAWSAGFGNGGQRLFVVPDLDLTVVITAGAYNRPQIARTVNLLFEQIVGAVRG